MGIAQVRLQGQQPFAARSRKNSYITWNRSLYAFLLNGDPSASDDPTHQVLQHLGRRHDDHRTERRAADRQNSAG